MPAHLDCSELFFVLWTQSHSPSSGTLLMWFPLLEMISLFPAYLWNPIHVCVHVTTIFLMLMNSVSQKCRQNTAGTTYLSSTLSGISWEDLNDSGDSMARSCKCPKASSLTANCSTANFTHIWHVGWVAWKLLNWAVDRSTYNRASPCGLGFPQPGSLEVLKVECLGQKSYPFLKAPSQRHVPHMKPFPFFPFKQMCLLSFETSVVFGGLSLSTFLIPSWFFSHFYI